MLTLLLKCGKAKGRRTFRLRLRGPSGQTYDGGEISFDFTGGPDSGHHIRMPLRVVWEQEGLYWFEILAGDELFARTPLRVRIADSDSAPGAAEGRPVQS